MLLVMIQESHISLDKMKGVHIIRWNSEDKPEIDKIRDNLDNEGLDHYTFVCSPGDFFEEHKHGGHEIRIVVDGQMEYGVGDEKFVLGPGDRIEMEPEVVHTAKAIGDKKVVTIGAEK